MDLQDDVNQLNQQDYAGAGLPSARNRNVEPQFGEGTPGANGTHQTSEARGRVGTPLDDVPVDGQTAKERAGGPDARVATPKTLNQSELKGVRDGSPVRVNLNDSLVQSSLDPDDRDAGKSQKKEGSGQQTFRPLRLEDQADQEEEE